MIMKRFLVYGIAILFVLTACEQVQDSGETGGLGSTDNPGTEEKLFTITGSGSGPLKRGSSRQYVVNPKYDVTWTVEGNTDSGTAVTALDTTKGRLKVGKEETNKTLVVKATSVDYPQAFGTVTVTVDGFPAVWTELTDRLAGLITNKANCWIWFSVSVVDPSFGINVLAYGEGVGSGKGRWVAGGGSDDVNTTPDFDYPVMAYSDDDGDSWTEIHPVPALLYQETPMCLIYDGPAGEKKFVLSTGKGSVFWSYDGITWTRVPNVLPDLAPADSLNYLDQVI
jgi:hypothetical protein